METLAEVMPIIICFLLVILLVVAIILGIKLIITLQKVEDVVDDVSTKVKSLDKVFNIIDFATDRMSLITDTVTNFIVSTFKKLFNKNSKKEELEDE